MNGEGNEEMAWTGSKNKSALDNLRGQQHYLEKISHSIDQKIPGSNIHSNHSQKANIRKTNEQVCFEIKSLVRHSVEGLNDIFNLKDSTTLFPVNKKNPLRKEFEIIEEENCHNDNNKKNVYNNNDTLKIKEVSTAASATGMNTRNSIHTNASKKNKVISTQIRKDSPIKNISRKKNQSKKTSSKAVELSEDSGLYNYVESIPSEIHQKERAHQATPISKNLQFKRNTPTATSYDLGNKTQNDSLINAKIDKNIKLIKEKISSKILTPISIKSDNYNTQEDSSANLNVSSKNITMSTRNSTSNVNHCTNLTLTNRTTSKNCGYNQQQSKEREIIEDRPNKQLSISKNEGDIYMNSVKQGKGSVKSKNNQIKSPIRNKILEEMNNSSSIIGLTLDKIDKNQKSLDIQKFTKESSIQKDYGNDQVPDYHRSKSVAMPHDNNYTAIGSSDFPKNAGIPDILKMMLMFNEYIRNKSIVKDNGILLSYSRLLCTLLTSENTHIEQKTRERYRDNEYEHVLKIQRAWRKFKVRTYLRKNHLNEENEMRQMLVTSVVQTEGFGIRKVFWMMNTAADIFGLISQKSKNIHDITKQLISLTNGRSEDRNSSGLYKDYINSVILNQNCTREYLNEQANLKNKKLNYPQNALVTMKMNDRIAINLKGNEKKEIDSFCNEKENPFTKSCPGKF